MTTSARHMRAGVPETCVSGSRAYSTDGPTKPDTAPPKESSGPYTGMFISVGGLAAMLAAYMLLNKDAKKDVLKSAGGTGPAPGAAAKPSQS